MSGGRGGIAAGLAARRQREEEDAFERTIQRAHTRREGRELMSPTPGGGGEPAASPPPRLSAQGLRPKSEEELLASVREAIVQSGRTPWWDWEAAHLPRWRRAQLYYEDLA